MSWESWESWESWKSWESWESCRDSWENCRDSWDSCAKPYSEVDSDHHNNSNYQLNIVDEHTEVAAESSLAKLPGPLIVSSIVVIRSLQEIRV